MEVFGKGKCPKCSGHYDFPMAALGEQIPCPHCGRTLVLFSGRQAAPPAVAENPPVVPVGRLAPVPLLGITQPSLTNLLVARMKCLQAVFGRRPAIVCGPVIFLLVGLGIVGWLIGNQSRSSGSNGGTGVPSVGVEDNANMEAKARRSGNKGGTEVLTVGVEDNATMEAKAGREKQRMWIGPTMRRAGFEEAQITRTLTQGGTVVVWGNKMGSSVPPDLSGVVAIAAGEEHTVALRNDSSVVVWGAGGENANSTLKFGQATVPVAAKRGVAVIAAGLFHTVALRHDGIVVAWGQNYAGQTDVPAAVQGKTTAIAAGGRHTLALQNDGTVVAWGYNNNGQTSVPSGLKDVVAIAAGGTISIALRDNGTVVAWGQFLESKSFSFFPISVPAGLSSVVSIAAGNDHAVALKGDGTVMAWGNNRQGQTKVPAGLTGVVAIAAGGEHTLALKKDGAVVAWGAGTSDTGGYPNSGQSIVPVVGRSRATAIAAGTGHSVAIISDGMPAVLQPGSPSVMESANRVPPLTEESSNTVNLTPRPITAAEMAIGDMERRVADLQKKRAEKGSAIDQYELALRYLAGEGVEANTPEAMRLLESAAALGNSNAANLFAIERISRVPETDASLAALKSFNSVFQPTIDASAVPVPGRRPLAVFAMTTTRLKSGLVVPVSGWKPVAKFEAKRYGNARQAGVNSFPLALEAFVQGISKLVGTNYTTFWGSDPLQTSLISKPTYLAGFMGISPNPDDPYCAIAAYGISYGSNVVRLLQVQITSSAGENLTENEANENLLIRNLSSLLTSVGVTNAPAAEKWAREVLKGNNTPAYQTRVASLDRTRTTDGTVRLYVEECETVRLTIRTHDTVYIPSNLLKSDLKGKLKDVRVYIVPRSGKVYLANGEYGITLGKLPETIRSQFGDLLSL